MFVDACRYGDLFHVGLGGVDGYTFLQQHLVPGFEHSARGGVGRRGIEAHFREAGADIEVHGGIQVGRFHAANIPERIPVHVERPGFVGLEPTVIGLIIRVGAHHQLDVRAVLIGQGSVPSLAAGAVAPGPELLAGYDIVVGHAHGSGLFAVGIAGKEIILVVPGEDRIRRDVVFVPTDIDALGKIRTAVGGMGNRPVCEFALGVVYPELRAGREDYLVVFVGVDRQ